MTGAMYAAISGLKTHMEKLNVIGNNIANVNTYGYKSQRTVFKEALYTTLSGGSNGTSQAGGNNPSQIGYGVEVGSIGLDMSTGNYSPTGRATDCMIDGDGFFLVGDKTVADNIDPTNPDSLKSLTLTRVGDFEFRADGYLCDGNGQVVYGFLTTSYKDENDNTITGVSDQLVPIRLPKMEITQVDTGDQDDEGNPITKTVYTVAYPTTGENGTGVLKDATATDENGDPTGEELDFAAFDSIAIDGTTGKITGTTKDTDETVVIGYLAIGNVTNPNGVSHQSGPYYKALEGAGDLSISMLGGVASDLGIEYVNGSLLNTDDAGDDVVLPDGMKINSAGTTGLITGGLEASKTDLATEISEMITTQRGYQANTRIITVTDSMLEELVNIKR